MTRYRTPFAPSGCVGPPCLAAKPCEGCQTTIDARQVEESLANDGVLQRCDCWGVDYNPSSKDDKVHTCGGCGRSYTL